MVGQAFDLVRASPRSPLGHPLPGERLQGLDDARVQRTPPLLEQRLVGHLLSEGVLEGIFELGKEVGLVEEFRGLQLGERTVQARLGDLPQGLKQQEGYVRADDGGGLQEALLLGWQSIDASRQHRLHRALHLDARERLR